MPTLLPLSAATATATDACCGPAPAALTPEAAADVAATFKALADPTRVRLVSAIASANAGEVCICDLTEPFDLTQPTLSHHLAILTRAGLVEREQRGRWAYFRLAPAARELAAAAVTAAFDPIGAAR
jgi:ArsR family transcriptional regulator